MTEKELRERALKVWMELNGYDDDDDLWPGDCDAIKDIAAALEAAYREGVEALQNALNTDPYSNRIRYLDNREWVDSICARLLEVAKHE